MDVATSSWFLAFAGLFAGFVLGFAARANHFCTMSGLERHWYANDDRGLRTWVLAAATALAATQALQALGHIDTGASFYIRSDFGWVGAIAGGIAFGFGMALVGTCGFGALVRLGGGSLRSLVVLIVLGMAAMSAQKGLVAQARVALSDNLAIDLSDVGGQSLSVILSHVAGHDLTVILPALAAIAMFAWIFKSARYRRHYGSIATGITVGLVIAFGWWATAFAARHSFDIVQIEAGSFVVPVGDSIMQLATYTGTIPDYGVGLIFGTLVGGALAAWRRKEVRWEACDDGRELSRHLAGAALMGVGGVFAMGCTIGQGITAVSAMAVSAPVVIVSIAVGARMGLAHLVEGSVMAAFRRNDGGAHAPAE